jgi:hypothetical protein
MFSFFRRRKEADATARRIINQGRFLGAHTPREAVEMSWGRPLSENEWVRYASVWERIWRESLKERPIESEMRPPHQLRLAISAVTDEPVSGKNATENAANAVALLTTAIVKKIPWRDAGRRHRPLSQPIPVGASLRAPNLVK